MVVILVTLACLQDASLEELVQGLSEDSLEVRERSAAALLDRGKSALNVLQRAAKSDDPELSSRAKELVRHIELRNILGPRVRQRFPRAEHELLLRRGVKFCLGSKGKARREEMDSLVEAAVWMGGVSTQSELELAGLVLEYDLGVGQE